MQYIIYSVICHTLPLLLLLLQGGGLGKGEFEHYKDIVKRGGEGNFKEEIVEVVGLIPHANDPCDNFYGGIGIIFGVGRKLEVVYPGYPADLAGMEAGDEIISPENTIRGEIGTEVAIVYKNKTGRIITLRLIRDKICTR